MPRQDPVETGASTKSRERWESQNKSRLSQPIWNKISPKSRQTIDQFQVGVSIMSRQCLETQSRPSWDKSWDQIPTSGDKVSTKSMIDDWPISQENRDKLSTMSEPSRDQFETNCRLSRHKIPTNLKTTSRAASQPNPENISSPDKFSRKSRQNFDKVSSRSRQEYQPSRHRGSKQILDQVETRSRQDPHKSWDNVATKSDKILTKSKQSLKQLETGLSLDQIAKELHTESRPSQKFRQRQFQPGRNFDQVDTISQPSRGNVKRLLNKSRQNFDLVETGGSSKSKRHWKQVDTF